MKILFANTLRLHTTILFSLITILFSNKTEAQLKMYNHGTPNKFEVANDIIVLTDSSKIICGIQYPSQTSAGLNARQTLVYKLDANENFVWGFQLQSSLVNSGKIKLASDGNIFFYGFQSYLSNNYSSSNGFIAKINQNNGTIIWQREINSNYGIGACEVKSVVELAGGNIVISGVGYDQATNYCSTNSYIAKLNSAGTVISSNFYNFGVDGAACSNDYFNEILKYQSDSLVIVGSKRGGNSNGIDNRTNSFLVLFDTSLNIGATREMDIRFTESGQTAVSNGFSQAKIFNNKIIGLVSVSGPNWTTNVYRYGIMKIDLSSLSIDFCTIFTTNLSHSSFPGLTMLDENRYYFTQASTPAFYGYTTNAATIPGSANSYISKMYNNTLIFTKTVDDIGIKGFNGIEYYNNFLYGYGFSHQGNNQIGEQDIFIAQTDTNFSSFEICSYQDSNEVFTATPSATYFFNTTYTTSASTLSNSAISLNLIPLVYSSTFVNDEISILNECQCIYRDTNTINCLPYITVNNDTITSPGIYAVDSVIYPFNCDTIYYLNIPSADVIPPTAVCKNDTVYLNTLGTATIDSSNIDNGSSDNCSIQTITVSPNSFNCTNIGNNSVTLTVTDMNGNTNSCNATLTVFDTISPNPICKDSTVYIDATGNIVIDSSFIDNGSSDNCGIASITVFPNSFNCNNLGVNTVTLTATDLNGNSASCNANLTVLDTNSPQANCTDITVYLDSNGVIVLDSNAVDNTSTDNCSIQTMSVSPNTFNCTNIGVNLVTLTVYDASGNTSSCQANVTILDDISPVVNCPLDVNDTVTGVCEFEVPNYTTQVNSVDNCNSSSVTYTQSPPAGTVIPINYDGTPTNTIVTITATDNSSNTNLCSFNVNISCVPELQIPQFFSPNGDGKNDTWEIIGISAFPENDVKIFNRYGELVYHKLNYDNTWSGKSNSNLVLQGKMSDDIVPSGTYYYILKTVYLKEETTYTGFLQLEK